jgi:hypothetical protein
VKVVEGSEIYNFPIHHFVHLYSTFWSLTCSNRDTVTQLRPADAAPRPRHNVAHAGRAARHASARPLPRCLRPCAPSPGRPTPLDASESVPLALCAGPAGRAPRRTAGPTAVSLLRVVPRPRTRFLRC